MTIWPWARKQTPEGMYASLPNSDQIVTLDIAAKRHIEKHRQRRIWDTEAGGQLFGVVTSAEVRILSATGPYRLDERTRYSYRSDPDSAQRAIDKAAKQNMTYIGEWHTHAEAKPNPSCSDQNAIETLASRSRLNTNALILLILGQLKTPDGLAICIYKNGKLTECEWQAKFAVNQSNPP